MKSSKAIKQTWDWYAAALLLTMLFIAALRLSITDWTSSLGYVELVAVLGGAAGLTLGASRLSGRAAALIALLLALVIIPAQASHVVVGQNTLQKILTEEGVRLWAAFQHLAAREPVSDPIFFITLVSGLFWWIGLHCGYHLVRRTSLLNVLFPATLPALIVQYYDGNDPARIWVVAFYFLFLLLLMGRIHVLRSREKWEAMRVFSGADSEFNLARSLVTLASVVVLLAWIMPGPGAALPSAARIWQELTKPSESLIQWMDQALDALRSGPGNGLQAYGNTLGLGVRANQDAQPVFRVVPPSGNFPRYYWQMRIYDTYEDGTWSNAHKNWSRDFAPEDGDLPIPQSRATRSALFSFIWAGNTTTLLAIPAQPLWVSLPSTIQYEDAQPGQVDLSSWHTNSYVQSGDEYTARAGLLSPSVNALRRAGLNYPQWVTERSLQVPNNLPDTVRVLAQDLTRNQPTPYDKAVAVTDYLRREIKYSPSIVPAPPGIDALDWFLFTWKSGYCNYYATAEVIMLRSVGIPARMVVGYAQGQRGADGAFTVRGRDSHAWAQIYFPNIGWVDFEPTANQPEIPRPVESAAETDDPANAQQVPVIQPTPLIPQTGQGQEEPNRPISYQSLGVWVIILGILFAAGYGLWHLERKHAIRRRIPRLIRATYERYGLSIPNWLETWERWSNATAVERSFQAINHGLTWLGHPQPPHATPTERADLLKTLLPSLSKEIERLKVEHENTLFSQTPGDSQQAARAAWIIRWYTARVALQRLIGVKDE